MIQEYRKKLEKEWKKRVEHEFHMSISDMRGARFEVWVVGVEQLHDVVIDDDQLRNRTPRPSSIVPDFA